MPIEQSLDRLATAIEKYTEVLTAAVAVASTKTDAKDAPAPKSSKPAKAETTEAPKKAAAEKPAKTAAPKTEGISYEQVKARTLEVLAAKGRDAVQEILTEFGDFTSAKELDPSQYQEFVGKLDELMGGEEDDMA